MDAGRLKGLGSGGGAISNSAEYSQFKAGVSHHPIFTEPLLATLTLTLTTLTLTLTGVVHHVMPPIYNPFSYPFMIHMMTAV